MLNFLISILKYCKQQTLACKPLSTEVITFDGDEVKTTNASVYDLAYAGICPDIYCKTRLEALELIDNIKLMLCLSQDDLNDLGENVSLYLDAVCRCLAKIDYNHILYQYDSKIDYDFFKCCLEEGLMYDRLYYITQVVPVLTSYLIGQVPFVESKKLEYVAYKIKKTKKLCLRGVALVLNGEVVANIPGYCQLEDNEPDDYDRLINNEEFKDQVLYKLPDKLQEAIVRRDKGILEGRGESNITLLAFYVSAIICQYGNNYFGVKMTDTLFEKALGLNSKSFSKKRAKRLKEIGNYKLDPYLVKVVQLFDKYEQMLTKVKKQAD